MSPHRVLSAGGALLVGVLILAGCSAREVTTVRTPAPSVTAPPTCVPVPGPCPVSGLLDPPPQHCPASPPMQVLTRPNSADRLYGASPVWTGALAGATLHVEEGGTPPIPWPGTKIIWEVGPNYTQPVTVVVTNLATSELAWWGHGGPPKAQALVLDPNTQEVGEHHGSPGPGWPVAGWNEYGSFLYIFTAGCYAMEVIWPEGSWRVNFAVGR